MFKCLQIMPNIMRVRLRYMFEKSHPVKVSAFPWHSVKSRVILDVCF